jgi:hypothetical protein
MLVSTFHTHKSRVLLESYLYPEEMDPKLCPIIFNRRLRIIFSQVDKLRSYHYASVNHSSPSCHHMHTSVCCSILSDASHIHNPRQARFQEHFVRLHGKLLLTTLGRQASMYGIRRSTPSPMPPMWAESRGFSHPKFSLSWLVPPVLPWQWMVSRGLFPAAAVLVLK